MCSWSAAGLEIKFYKGRSVYYVAVLNRKLIPENLPCKFSYTGANVYEFCFVEICLEC